MPEEAKDVYANEVRIMIGPYDIMLDFGLQTRTPGPEGETSVTSIVRVRMSHSHGKVMTKLLSRRLDEYERKHGTIVVPKDIYDQLGMME